MKILAFAATNSQQSINKQLVTYATQILAQKMPNQAQIDIIDLNDYEMPIYSIDRENASGIPEKAHQFFNKIQEAEAILIAFAEHNGTFTAAYKNLYDWASRINMRVYDNKPVLLLATSIGASGGKNVLQSAVDSLPHFGAKVCGTFSLPSFNDNFDTEALAINDTEQVSELSQQMDNLLTELSVTQ